MVALWKLSVWLWRHRLLLMLLRCIEAITSGLIRCSIGLLPSRDDGGDWWASMQSVSPRCHHDSSGRILYSSVSRRAPMTILFSVNGCSALTWRSRRVGDRQRTGRRTNVETDKQTDRQQGDRNTVPSVLYLWLSVHGWLTRLIVSQPAVTTGRLNWDYSHIQISSNLLCSVLSLYGL